MTTSSLILYQTFDNQSAARVQDLMEQTGADLECAIAAVALANEETQQASRHATHTSLFHRLGLRRKK